MENRMEIENAQTLIREMRCYAEQAGVSLLAVGSVGYKSALLHPEFLSGCDDLDCIFIYETPQALDRCPYMRPGYWNATRQLIENGTADMVSTKLEAHSIHISADFVSQEYLRTLAKEPFTGEDRFRVKVTDAVENSTNTYCSFDAKQLVYQKPCRELSENIRLYTLPTQLYREGSFYPGVLLNKFLYNPAEIRMQPKDRELVRMLQSSVADFCRRQSAHTGVPGSVMNTAYRKEDFSAETQQFLSR